MDETQFDAVVIEAIETLPPEFTAFLQNVDVLVEARPSPGHRRAARIKPWQELYGLYEGVPLTARYGSAPLLPDTITIFRQPLMRDFPNHDALRQQIRRTVLHEIAHHFGIDDDRLRELGAY